MFVVLVLGDWNGKGDGVGGGVGKGKGWGVGFSGFGGDGGWDGMGWDGMGRVWDGFGNLLYVLFWIWSLRLRIRDCGKIMN